MLFSDQQFSLVCYRLFSFCLIRPRCFGPVLTRVSRLLNLLRQKSLAACWRATGLKAFVVREIKSCTRLLTESLHNRDKTTLLHEINSYLSCQGNIRSNRRPLKKNNHQRLIRRILHSLHVSLRECLKQVKLHTCEECRSSLYAVIRKHLPS